MVPSRDRQQQTHHGYLVADGNRHDPDYALALRPIETGLRHETVPGHRSRCGRSTRQSPSDQSGGFAVIKKPWPSMMRTIYKDPDRYKTYWNTIPNCYTAGDVCHKDADGYMWFMGRADDVIKVAGNRIGTAEVESALVSHQAVAEAAVIGKPHKTVGESIKAFIILKQGVAESPRA